MQLLAPSPRRGRGEASVGVGQLNRAPTHGISKIFTRVNVWEQFFVLLTSALPDFNRKRDRCELYSWLLEFFRLYWDGMCLSSNVNRPEQEDFSHCASPKSRTWKIKIISVSVAFEKFYIVIVYGDENSGLPEVAYHLQSFCVVEPEFQPKAANDARRNLGHCPAVSLVSLWSQISFYAPVCLGHLFHCLN